jgi:hypothetical protein
MSLGKNRQWRTKAKNQNQNQNKALHPIFSKSYFAGA